MVAGGYFGYTEYIRLRAVDEQFASLAAERSALAEKLARIEAESKDGTAKLSELGAKAKLFDASRLALQSGRALRLIESAVKENKNASAEDYLALGGVRLLMNGEQDAEAAADFEKALELSNWPSTKKLTCAAQFGLLAAGKTTKVASDCTEITSAAGQPQ